MSSSFLEAPTALLTDEVASQVTMAINASASKHSPMTSLPTELFLNIVSHFTMAQFLRFRGVCRLFHQTFDGSERIIVWQLLRTPEFWLAGRIFGNTGPEMESYKHLFGLKRRCSIVDTLAKFLSEYSLEEHGEDGQLVETEIRSPLLLLTHYLEHHRLSLKAFVSNPNNEPFLGVPNEEIEVLTLAKYNHEAAYLLCGLHKWLIRLLVKRLDGRALTKLDKAHALDVGYAELLVLGGIEAIRDSILPDTIAGRYDKVEAHMERACSDSRVNDTGYVSLQELPARTVDLALVLEPIMPPLNHQTAVSMCGILPKDYNILERLIIRLPDKPSSLWQVDTRDAVSDFELEVGPDNRSSDSERSPMDDVDSDVWLNKMILLNNTRLTRVL